MADRDDRTVSAWACRAACVPAGCAVPLPGALAGCLRPAGLRPPAPAPARPTNPAPGLPPPGFARGPPFFARGYSGPAR